MAPRKNHVASGNTPAAAAAPAKAKQSGSAVRKIAPAIPLAVALLHGAMTGSIGSAGSSTQGGLMGHASTVTSSSVPGCGSGTADSSGCTAPVPMLSKGHPVNWWFVFKLNAGVFPGCGSGTIACPFGGQPQTGVSGLQYAYASSESPKLQAGGGDCLGDTTSDPVGATFAEVYTGGFHFVVWNDQFYGDPKSASCGGEGCDSPWGHSKGMVAWNDQGDGMVMQVTTPDWPGAGSSKNARAAGNTLGCVSSDNDIKVSQHFFALRLTHDDLDTVLDGLSNASVVTDPTNPQIVNNGGPVDVQAKVTALGKKSSSTTLQSALLSSGVGFIAKPSLMHVPPWQMVSSVLGGVPLRAATWWAAPEIPSTTGGTPGCWDSSLTTPPGAVDIALKGTWEGKTIGLQGGLGNDANHAKVGVSTSANDYYAIFGDMNQQGQLSTNCGSSQNGRGGTFFIVENQQLSTSLAALIAGASAPQ